jgi:hypothetical protein
MQGPRLDLSESPGLLKIDSTSQETSPKSRDNLFAFSGSQDDFIALTEFTGLKAGKDPQRFVIKIRKGMKVNLLVGLDKTYSMIRIKIPG